MKRTVTLMLLVAAPLAGAGQFDEMDYYRQMEAEAIHAHVTVTGAGMAGGDTYEERLASLRKLSPSAFAAYQRLPSRFRQEIDKGLMRGDDLYDLIERIQMRVGF